MIKDISVLVFVLGFVCSLVGCGISSDKEVDHNLTFYVNPFIGASTNAGSAGIYHGLGKTFPGATSPFGMVQVSPNTISVGDNRFGYSYEHTSIEGFAHTQMSGIGWNGDFGNYLVTPTIGKLFTNKGSQDNTSSGYRSNYSKETEAASPGNYYIKSDKLIGKNYDKCYINYKDIVQGGELNFEIDSIPNKLWGK